MSTDDTVVQLRPRRRKEDPPVTTLDKEIQQLVASSRLQGELELMARLHSLGTPLVLANDVSVAELMFVLERAGLTLSTVEGEGVQAIHRSDA